MTDEPRKEPAPATPPGEWPDPTHDVPPTKPPAQSNPNVPVQPKPETV